MEEELSFEDDVKVDPITGRKEKRSLLSKLNGKNKITRQEMDEIFLQDDNW